MGALIGYLLADRLGRRNGILWSVPPAIVLAMIYPFVKDPILTPLVGFLFLSSLYAFFAFGFYGYLGELFPTAFRLRGIGFAHTIGRVVTMVTPFMVAFLYSKLRDRRRDRPVCRAACWPPSSRCTAGASRRAARRWSNSKAPSGSASRRRTWWPRSPPATPASLGRVPGARPGTRLTS